MHAIYRKVAVLPQVSHETGMWEATSHAGFLQIPHPNQFRFALTYEMVVPMMSAHILVPLVNGSHFDVSNRRLTTGNKQVWLAVQLNCMAADTFSHMMSL